MRRVRFAIHRLVRGSGVIILFCIFCLNSAHSAVLNLPTVTVMADHNLSLVITEIARNYSRGKQVVVNTSFASQEAQQKQISEGSSADILITSKSSWIEDLKLQGLVDIYSQFKLAGDKMVLIGSSQSNIASQGAGRFPSIAIIATSTGNPVLLLGNPESLMEGVYAKESLDNLGVANDLEPYILYVKRIEDMFSAVTKQQVFAMCFNSSTNGRNDIKIIDTIPDLAHQPINYTAVVIAGDNMDEARKFLEYLKTQKVKTILKDNGFIIE